MKSNSKSNSIFASIGRGIKQAARWVAKMFSYKVENKFARGVWYVFATGAAVLALYFAVVPTILTTKGMSVGRNCKGYDILRVAQTWELFCSPILKELN